MTMKAMVEFEEELKEVKKKNQGKKEKLSVGEEITRYCEENIKNFFRDKQEKCFVVLPIDDHLETASTKGSPLRNWIAGNYREKYGSPPGSEAIKQAIIQIEVMCGKTDPVELFNRVGWHDKAIYYDLTTKDWQGIKITQEGWSQVPLPVMFRRYSHQTQQTFPLKDGNPKDILNYVNILEDDHCLFLVTLATFFIPGIPHVVPILSGTHGSGKSSVAVVMKKLVDPSSVLKKSRPKDLDDAALNAENQWVGSYDNISNIPSWFSDHLCCGVTGAGDLKRMLFKDDDAFIRAYQRCFILNGIGNFVNRPDLLDRSIIFEILPLDIRKTEKEIEESLAKSFPGILGGFFTAISNAMGKIEQIQRHKQFRMADFAQWGGALADALGYSSQDFFEKYSNSIKRKWTQIGAEDPLIQKIKPLVEANWGREWSGSAADLFEKIKSDTKEKDIPKTVRGLSLALARLAPISREAGIEIRKPLDNNGRFRRQAGTGYDMFVIKCVSPEGCEQRCEESVSNLGICEQDDNEGGNNGERPY